MYVKTIKTRMTKDSDQVETVLTLDWEGVTTEQLIGLAESTVIIDLQAVYRNSSIPKEDTVKVAEFLGRPKGSGGFKPTPENMAARISKQSKEDFRKTLELLSLDEETIDLMVEKKFS